MSRKLDLTCKEQGCSNQISEMRARATDWSCSSCERKRGEAERELRAIQLAVEQLGAKPVAVYRTCLACQSLLHRDDARKPDGFCWKCRA